MVNNAAYNFTPPSHRSESKGLALIARERPGCLDKGAEQIKQFGG
jgi:hypothetical protein